MFGLVILVNPTGLERGVVMVKRTLYAGTSAARYGALYHYARCR